MKTHNNIKYLVVASIMLFASQSVFAQGVGNLGSLPTHFETTNPPSGWTVVSSTGPIPVVLDPTGPVWGKAFTGPNGSNFFYPPTSPNNPPLAVNELLQVSGNLPWTDWHEEVIGIDASGAPDYGWTWANPVIYVGGLPAPGLTVTGVGTNLLTFDFDPILPGTIVNIRKELVYTGLPGATFIGTLAVHEYPTPEPASLALLVFGGVLALRRRGRMSPA